MSYKKYSDKTKYIIQRLGFKDLFQHQNIPRTTIDYWLKSEPINSPEELNDCESALIEKIEELKEQLKSEQQLRKFLYKVKKIAPLNKNADKVTDHKKKVLILEEINTLKKRFSLNEVLPMIGLSKSTYFRWQSEIYPNRLRTTPTRLQLNQLTSKEIYKMRQFLNSEKYMHYPIHSLFYYALRNDDIVCSKQTWYKYAKIFNIARWNKLPKYKVKYEEGIRANKINEIWHIDVTQFKLNGKTFYVQVIMDNFSRYIISYQITSCIGSLSTVKTIKEAERNLIELSRDCALMMDAGTENINKMVEKFLISKNIKRVVAKIDIKYSNSMIESMFRSLKNNYLYHQKIKNFEGLKRKLVYYFKQHNDHIPHSAFKGATPKEIYTELWSEGYEEYLKDKIQNRLKTRRLENLHSYIGKTNSPAQK